jgi:hypothetical protein
MIGLGSHIHMHFLKYFGVGCYYWMVLEIIFLDLQEKMKNIARKMKF